MLNRIWVSFILVGFVAATVQTFQGDLALFTRVLTGLFDTAKTGFEISIGLVGIAEPKLRLDHEELLQQAENTLQQAVDAGRNRARVCQLPDS